MSIWIPIFPCRLHRELLCFVKCLMVIQLICWINCYEFYGHNVTKMVNLLWMFWRKNYNFSLNITSKNHTISFFLKKKYKACVTILLKFSEILIVFFIAWLTFKFRKKDSLSAERFLFVIFGSSFKVYLSLYFYMSILTE